MNQSKEINMLRHSLVCALFTAALTGLLMTPLITHAQDKDKPVLKDIPAKVLDGLKEKFPKAEIQKWTREEEDGMVIYDIEFEQEGRKFEADIKEDGTIHNWEKAIMAADLPDAVKKAVEDKYPESTVKQVMAVTDVQAGEDVLEGYEISLETVEKNKTEITIAQDGKILEEGEGE